PLCPAASRAEPGSSAPPDRPRAPDQQAGADRPGDEIADPAPERHAEQAEEEACHRGPDDAEQDVQEDPGVGFHEAGCDPACKAADDDGCDPAHALLVHSSLLSAADA